MTRVLLYATVCVLVRERTLKTRRDCQAEVNGEAEDNLEEGTFNTLLGPGHRQGSKRAQKSECLGKKFKPRRTLELWNFENYRVAG